MPVVPLESFAFPEGLFDRSDVCPDPSCHWWALQTRPRSEKCLARRFIAVQTPFFLPLWNHRWVSRGRTMSAHLPLFPGYIFMLGDSEARLAALGTHLVARCLAVEDQRQLHADLARIHHLMASGAALVPEKGLMPGMLVEITCGPLAGLEGRVMRCGPRFRFIVEVHFLQRGASVEVEGWMIRPAAGASQSGNLRMQ